MAAALVESGDASAALDSKFDKDMKPKGSKGPSSSKAKDTSHVPCKFFRVGSCAAGSSCTFSHQALEPGQHKEICAWFLKGNCKFGHKCALSHGQTVSEDRRNKKAAQLAAGAGQKDRPRDGREREKDTRGGRKVLQGAGQSAGQGAGRSGPMGLLSGSTAPTRVLPPGARLPLPISKSQLAPAAPAPALQDADFAKPEEQTTGSRGTRAAAEATSPSRETAEPIAQIAAAVGSPPVSAAAAISPSRVDMSPFSGSPGARQPLQYANAIRNGHPASPSVDFGPVGSPPRISPVNPLRINGFSPGTSPRDAALHNTQPFASGVSGFGSAAPPPGAMPPPPQGFYGESEFKSRSGLAASLGGGPPAPFGAGSLPILSRGMANYHESYAEALDEGDMEDFVPSSLKDLLTPEEQNRRMSRTSSVAPGQSTLAPLPNVNRAGMAQDNRHRYSRSVPAPSLLNDIRSIWADSDGELSGSGVMKDMPSSVTSNSIVGGGLSSSYKSSFTADGPSPSMLHPANASAAFLSGLHTQQGRPSVGTRAVSHGSAHLLQNNLGGGFVNGNGLNGSQSHLGSQLSISMSIANAFPSSPSQLPFGPDTGAGRPIPPSGAAYAGAPLRAQQEHVGHLSPGARALQAHAPGQSLPQGLAAGYSRIHLQPVATSPGSAAAFSPGSGMGGIQQQLGVGSFSDQKGMGVTNGIGIGSPPGLTGLGDQAQALNGGAANTGGGGGVSAGVGSAEAGGGGLTTMFSHLSYSSVARGAHAPSVAAAAAGSSVPLSMSRRPSGRQWPSAAHALSSPLSGPVITNDDDELFSMDEVDEMK